MFPAYEDVLRIQAIELNDKIRRSNFSFTISDNVVRFTPVFNRDTIVWFDYYVVSEKGAGIADVAAASGSSLVSDFSNIPFDHIEYREINSIGRTWIYKYTLTLAKEMLGRIRSKYETIPIPNDSIRLDGNILLSEAADEKKYLIEEIRETLDKTSKHGQLQREAENVQNQLEVLKGVPLPFYVF